MDVSPVSLQSRSREQTIQAGKKKFQSFRAKQAQNMPGSYAPAPQTHTRSHSRSGSSSAPITPSISDPTSQSTTGTRSRPNSQHKRNSSVSTRRESAELMGVAVAAEDLSEKDADPVRRALMALEGKHSSASPRNSFVNRAPKVQIPDLDVIEKADWSEPRKPFALNTSLAGKRDSFGKLLAYSSGAKIELGTLLEEEEEDEENVVSAKSTPVVTPSKPRPQTLVLRPLATHAMAVQSLPSPSLTPSPRITGLKSLTLASSPALLKSPSPAFGSSSRRPSQPTPLTPPASTIPVRKSSISYKRASDADKASAAKSKTAVPRRPVLEGILTPEPTPTIDSPVSPDLSPSRRAFIYQSHSALVARVADLEKLLASRSPAAFNNNVSLPSPALSMAGNDEFLSLIADLKTERDDLKREVEGWRVRVVDLEKQAALLVNRVETERKQAWVVREQLGVLEIAKAGIEEEGEMLKSTIQQLNEHVEQLQHELDQARHERDQAQREIAVLTRTSTLSDTNSLKFVGRTHIKPTNGFGFRSIDSLGSTTDVDDVASSHRSSLIAGLANACLKLKVVQEEHDDRAYRHDLNEFDEQAARELAHYEDEDSDGSVYSHSQTSSISLSNSAPVTPIAPLLIASKSQERAASPTHERKSSLTKTWTFAASAAKPDLKPAPVDNFFLCLEDPENDVDEDDSVDERQADDTLTRPKLGFGFGHGFGFGTPDDEDEDDLPPFVLPSVQTDAKLNVVEEDEEYEEDMDMGFTFPVRPPVQIAFSQPRAQTFQFPQRGRW